MLAHNRRNLAEIPSFSPMPDTVLVNLTIAKEIIGFTQVQDTVILLIKSNFMSETYLRPLVSDVQDRDTIAINHNNVHYKNILYSRVVKGVNNRNYNFIESPKYIKVAKVNGTRYSQAVTHPSTKRARRCLTSVIGREPVL